jgi:hypothetical protein
VLIGCLGSRHREQLGDTRFYLLPLSTSRVRSTEPVNARASARVAVAMVAATAATAATAAASSFEVPLGPLDTRCRLFLTRSHVRPPPLVCVFASVTLGRRSLLFRCPAAAESVESNSRRDFGGSRLWPAIIWIPAFSNRPRLFLASSSSSCPKRALHLIPNLQIFSRTLAGK